MAATPRIPAGNAEEKQVGIIRMPLAELEPNAMGVCRNWQCQAKREYGKVTDNARQPCTMSVEPHEDDKRYGFYLDPNRDFSDKTKVTPLDILKYNLDLAERSSDGHPSLARAVIRLECKTCRRVACDVLAEDTTQALHLEIRKVYCHDTKTLNLLYQPGEDMLPDDAKIVCDMVAKFPATDLLTSRNLECIERSLTNGRLRAKLEEKGQQARLKFDSDKKTYIRIGLGLKALGDHIAVLELWPKGFSSPIHHHGGCAGSVRVVHGTLDVKIFKSLIDKKPMLWKNGDAGLSGLPPEGVPVLQLAKGKTTWLNRSNFWTHEVACNPESQRGFALSVHLYKSCTDEFAMISQQQPQKSGPKNDFLWNVDLAEGDPGYAKLQQMMVDDNAEDFESKILGLEAVAFGIPAMDFGVARQAHSEAAESPQVATPAGSGDVNVKDLLEKAVKDGNSDSVNVIMTQVYPKAWLNPGLCDLILFQAVESGSSDVARLVSQRGCCSKNTMKRAVVTAEIKGSTAVADALLPSVRKGSQGLLSNLVQALSSTEATILKAVEDDDLEALILIARKGADVNQKVGGGMTLLHVAAYKGHMEVVRYLVEKGADVNQQRKDGERPLHRAAYNRHMEVVRYLVEKGADVNSKCKFGNTPLHQAADNGHMEVVRFLVEKGADVNQQRKDGERPLHRAAYNGHMEVVRYLVEKGADVNSKSESGQTPLHRAALIGHIEVVRYLVEKGANINQEDNNRETPLYWAARWGYMKVVRFLVDEKGADVNRQGNDGEAPLHQAACCGRIEVVRFLLEEGADVNLKNKDGKTPLQRAEEPAPSYYSEDRRQEKVDAAAFLRARAARR